mgnify:CR=1 FL=1
MIIIPPCKVSILGCSLIISQTQIGPIIVSNKKNKLTSVEELGYPQQYEIINFLKKINKSYTIIDSKELLMNPQKSLSDWCRKINIKFSKIKF